MVITLFKNVIACTYWLIASCNGPLCNSMFYRIALLFLSTIFKLANHICTYHSGRLKWYSLYHHWFARLRLVRIFTPLGDIIRIVVVDIKITFFRRKQLQAVQLSWARRRLCLTLSPGRHDHHLLWCSCSSIYTVLIEYTPNWHPQRFSLCKKGRRALIGLHLSDVEMTN